VSGFVLDCSVAAAWFFEDEARPETDALQTRARDGGVVVPSIWHLEVGNAFLQAEKKGRQKTEKVAAHIQLLDSLPIETDSETGEHALHETLTLARAHKLTPYDAAYLELALRRKLPLATKDEALRAVAQRLGIKILPE
jgi:predicted nucleic acid-binding protein